VSEAVIAGGAGEAERLLLRLSLILTEKAVF